MGCGCRDMASKQGEYANVHKIAKAYAVHEGATVAIYRRKDGTFSFVQIDCPEFAEVTPIEYLSPLL